MGFNPGYEIGQTVSNADIVNTFGCGNMGGMRRSHATNTLVIVSDYTKGLYHDKWIGGVLHYTGMGKTGDQDINWAQNATLAESNFNCVDVHLFEVMDPCEYIYCGRVKLVEKPYTETQPDESGQNRLVWMFPVRPVPDNDVVKPAGLVFKDMDDYKANGKHADAKYLRLHPVKTKNSSSGVSSRLKGKKVMHQTYGVGTVTKLQDNMIYITFGGNNKRTLDYEMCIEKKLIEFL